MNAREAVRAASDRAWERVCRELDTTPAELRAALSLMRSGRAFAEVDDPRVARVLEHMNRAGSALVAWNSPLNAPGGGLSHSKPESKAPGYQRCPDALKAFCALDAQVTRIMAGARIERQQSEHLNAVGGVAIEVEVQGEWVDRKLLDVKDHKLVATRRGKGGKFTRGVSPEHLDAKLRSISEE